MEEFQVPDMLNNYLIFCNQKNDCKKSKILDLSMSNWIYPTTLLPLGVFIKENKSIKYKPPFNPNVANYINLVTRNIELKDLKNKSYIPLVPLPKEEIKATEFIEYIYKFNNNGKDYGGENAFKYLISELVDNIYQHANFKNAWVMAQCYSNKGFVEIVFFDDGISIPGSFKKAGLMFDDEVAIGEAVNGLSTKDKDRGHGLSSNMKIFTKGLKGEMIIISGNGALYLNKNSQKLYKLQDLYKHQGTIIGVRIKYPTKVNIYEYIQ